MDTIKVTKHDRHYVVAGVKHLYKNRLAALKLSSQITSPARVITFYNDKGLYYAAYGGEYLTKDGVTRTRLFGRYKRKLKIETDD